MPTVGRLIERVCARFEASDITYGHGTDNAWDEAVALVLAVTALPDHEDSLAAEVAAEGAEQILAMAERRVETRAPLAHLLGSCRYAGFEFKVDPRVIVPRSPLAFLLGEPIEALVRGDIRRVLDLCCGSGCLGIVAAHTYPDAEVTYIDLDPAAVALTEANLASHGLAARAHVMRADILAADTARAFAEAPFDLILANPPYVDAADMAALPAEYRAEPELALAAGEDGLDVMGPVLERLSEWLTPEGLFLGEVGASEAALRRRYGRWPFIWPDEETMARIGGEGVFMLRSQDLVHRVE